MVIVLSVTPTVGALFGATVVAVPPPEPVRVPVDDPPPLGPLTAPVSEPAGMVSPGASDVFVESVFARPVPLTTCWLCVKPSRGVLTEHDARTTAAATMAAARHERTFCPTTDPLE